MPTNLIRVLVLLFCTGIVASSQADESARREAAFAALAKDDASMTIYFRSGASHQIQYDRRYGNLEQLKTDFASDGAQGKRKLYTYRGTNTPEGAVSVDLSKVEGIGIVYR
ncbi:MAG: hypothetical protein GYB33_14480 [Gammaproteobacteria bacterium]|nr:hypothetical protein [Gammaproteobacteria bacterium]